MPFDYAALEAARLARDPRDMLAPVDLPKPARPEPRGQWSVVKAYDDASQPDRPIRVNMTEADARRIAGDLRDGLSDADVKKCVDEGYNIVAKKKTKFGPPEQHAAPVACAHGGADLGRRSQGEEAMKRGLKVKTGVRAPAMLFGERVLMGDGRIFHSGKRVDRPAAVPEQQTGRRLLVLHSARRIDRYLDGNGATVIRKKREKPMTVSKIEAFKNSTDVGISGREWLRGRK